MTDRFCKQLYEFFYSSANFKDETVASMLKYFENYDILSTVTANSTSKTLQLDNVKLGLFFTSTKSILKNYLRTPLAKSVFENEFQFQEEVFVIGGGAAYLFNSICMLFLLIGALVLCRGKVKSA